MADMPCEYPNCTEPRAFALVDEAGVSMCVCEGHIRGWMDFMESPDHFVQAVEAALEARKTAKNGVVPEFFNSNLEFEGSYGGPCEPFQPITKRDQARILGQRVKIARITLGKTQVQVADHLGVTENYLSKIETGRCLPGAELLAGLAETLGLKPSDHQGPPDGVNFVGFNFVPNDPP